MENLTEQLMNVRPVDLAALADGDDERFAFLDGLRRTPEAGGDMLQRVQASMDAVRAASSLPAAGGDRNSTRPWWAPMPALYMAAMFRYAGLAEKHTNTGSGGARRSGSARDSAVAARRVLRSLGVPFRDREHAAALVLHQDRPFLMPRTGGPAEVYMRMSCRLDLRCLHALDVAYTYVEDGDAQRTKELEHFRERAERLGVFGRPWAGPMPAQDVRSLGATDAHRMFNALRYFRLEARMSEQDWYTERVKQEARMPRGRLHLLIGAAAAGKSRWAEKNLGGTEIVSSDRMRELLTGDPADQSQNYMVFQRCMDRVRTMLREGREVTFDATNYSRELRSMPVQAARWSAAEIVSYYFDVDREVLLTRNLHRRRQVPESVILKQSRLLTVPALYEADRQFAVDAEGELRQYWPEPEGECP